MLVPAAIYMVLQWHQPGFRGWGIPMATDIAFVVGAMAILGPRVPFGLKIMVLSLAIADDIGAVIVIAIFYSTGLNGLRSAWLCWAFVSLLHESGRRAWTAIYVAVGIGIWFALDDFVAAPIRQWLASSSAS